MTAGALLHRSAAFEDVAADDPGAEAMRWAHETGVQPALSATAYAPRTAVTRADLALALHRFAGSPAVDLDAMPALITDLCEDRERAAALLWLHGRGALWGDAELRVRPEEPATREGAAQMLVALLRPALAGVGVTWDPTALPAGEDGSSALLDLAWLDATGMVPAALADRIGDQVVTRAELATALHRADGVVSDALG